MAEGVESYAERARRNKRKRDGIPEPPAEEPTDPRLLPEGPTREHQDTELDQIIKSYPIVDAYNRWVAKEHVHGTGVEIKVSCPIPGHVDDEFSACINAEKNVWTCYVCEQGGDIYDLAAFKFGYDVPGYKTSKHDFPSLKTDIAEDLGYSVRRSSLTGKEYLSPTAPANPEPSPDGGAKPLVSGGISTLEAGEQLEEESSSRVISLGYDDEFAQDSEYQRIFKIDWRTLLPNNTFLRKFCEIGSLSDQPEEYFFWLGLSVIGLALGRDTHLIDSPPIHGNLYLTLLGSTGGGKSKAINSTIQFLRAALPFNENNLAGTMIVASPGSAESLIDSFSFPIRDDPGDPTLVTGYAAVRGLVRFDEFSTLVSRANRVGSTMKSILIEFYDANLPIELRSRGAGHVKAEDHFCTVITGTQPRAIAQIFAQADADSGFLNRWVFARGINKPLNAAMEIPIVFDDCIDLIQNIQAWSASHPTIRWTPAGLAAWEKFFRDKLEQYRLRDDTPIAARIDLTFKKVLLLFCADSHQAEVTPDVVERAAALHEYLARSYGLLGESLGMGQLEECMRAIERFLAKWKNQGKPAPSFRTLNNVLHKRYPRDVLVKALDVLMQTGSIAETRPENKHGPRTTRYTLIIT